MKNWFFSPAVACDAVIKAKAVSSDHCNKKRLLPATATRS
jgi:hypothetical protein